MKAYRYDPVSKKYIGEINCQIDPLETQTKGEPVYLLPANSTFSAPLHKDGFYTVWNGAQWEYVEIPQPEPEPQPEPPTHEEIRQARAEAYQYEVDPITAHIQRLRGSSPVPVSEIEELMAERDAKVAEIKQRLPYPDEQPPQE